MYSHLQYPSSVSVGAVVSIGKQIGNIGHSGDAGGVAHLHFEIRLGIGTGFTDSDGYNPNGAPSGWVDPTDFINTYRTITAPTISKPDLDVYYTPIVSTTTLAAGGSTTVSYDVDNLGTVSAASSTAGIYLSTDAIITRADTLLKTELTGPVSAGSWISESNIPVTLPSNLVAGTYYLGVIADYNSAISESNETNNPSGPVQITVMGSSSSSALSSSSRVTEYFLAAAPVSVDGADSAGRIFQDDNLARIDFSTIKGVTIGEGPFIAEHGIDLLVDDLQLHVSYKHVGMLMERFDRLELADMFGSGLGKASGEVVSTMSGHRLFEAHTDDGWGAITDIGSYAVSESRGCWRSLDPLVTTV